VVEGSLDDLRGEDTVLIDEAYKAKLGVNGVGDRTEINGHRARVVGFTRGVLSFTTAPYVFTSYKNGLNYLPGVKSGDSLFLLVQLAPGADLESVRRGILERVHGVDVFTNDELRRKTQGYWLFSTGAGITTLLGAALGLIVGIVVVAQTIYASTVERIREFGTLKAMGAGNGVIYRVIILQAVYSALAGYAIAIVIGYFVAQNSAASGAVILLPPEMAAGTLVAALGMCTLASVVSIRKATSIDPALVFRG
jgi:putative ABC transport system permease protein